MILDFYTVVIEWDGHKPPSTFYARLWKMGLIVRGNGDKSTSPLARRNHGKPSDAVIAQEGIYLCRAETTAREIALLAQEHGAKEGWNIDVWIGKSQLEDSFNVTEEDREVARHVQAVCGPKSGPLSERTKIEWTVTCFECGSTSYIPEAVNPLNCPVCSDFNFNSRPGAPISLDVEGDQGDTLSVWVNSRWATKDNGFNGFEVPSQGTNPLPAVNIASLSEDDQAWITCIAGSKRLLASISNMPRKQQLTVLDAAYAMGSIRSASRKENRLAGIMEIMKAGVDPGKAHIDLNPHDNDLDLLDCINGNGISAQVAADWYIHSTPGLIPAGGITHRKE